MKRLLLLALVLVPTLAVAKSLQEGQTIGSENGRYVLGQISSFRRDQYFLDTKTGRIWQIKEFEEAGSQIFEPILFSSLDGQSFSLSPTGPYDLKYVPKKATPSFPQGSQNPETDKVFDPKKYLEK